MQKLGDYLAGQPVSRAVQIKMDQLLDAVNQAYDGKMDLGDYYRTVCASGTIGCRLILRNDKARAKMMTLFDRCQQAGLMGTLDQRVQAIKAASRQDPPDQGVPYEPF